MRVGITLPTFRSEVATALDVAIRAEAAGIDGVFAFDHLWPIGHPERPALHGPTVLGAVAMETSRLHVGTMVARVSLVPAPDLIHRLTTLGELLSGRLIAGVGTGDLVNRDENVSYGIAFAPVSERVEALVACCRGLRARGARVWVGGHGAAVRRVAAIAADGWNGGAGMSGVGFDASGGLGDWRAEAAEISAWARKADRSEGPELTWGGQVLVGADPGSAGEKLARYGMRPGLVHGTVSDLSRHFSRLREAGASWAVCAPLDVGEHESVVEMVAEAARGAG
ncbi:MAG: LLM class flavin-dependent oxidoreductase [Acidimicrobiales bacterium]